MPGAIPLYRSEPIDLTVTPTGTQFNFQDFPQLRNAPIYGMDFYTPGTLTVSPLSGLALLPLANIKTAFMSIYMVTRPPGNSWGLYINQHPLINFNRTSNGTDPFVYDFTQFSGQIIQWQKCFIRLTTAVGGGTSYACYFQVWYGDPVASNQ